MNNAPTHNGLILFPDLAEMQDLTDAVIDEYYPMQLDARIIKDSDSDKLILLTDIPNTDDGWGGHFRCFLYPEDNKILGTFKYLKEAEMPEEKIDGKYEISDHVIKIQGLILSNGKPTGGIYAELYPFEEATEEESPESFTKTNDKIAAINAAVADWFAKHPETDKVPAKDLMDFFVARSIFPKDHRNGLPIRNILRALDKQDDLAAIPSAEGERKSKNTNWYFVKPVK